MNPKEIKEKIAELEKELEKERENIQNNLSIGQIWESSPGNRTLIIGVGEQYVIYVSTDPAIVNEMLSSNQSRDEYVKNKCNRLVINYNALSSIMDSFINREDW